ncbi:hypothetical protein, partial [Vibrio atlanticus]|uniref:hypothetical protein n=1 Tax=Vibrio atlanticus TaxID=693153 RepID=UPI00354CEE2B
RPNWLNFNSDNYPARGGYQVFNMIHGGHGSNGRSKIAGIDPVLRNATVRKEGEDWIATVS